MTDTDKDWRIWGETDPYYGVVASDEFRRENLDIDQFFRTGEGYILYRLATLERQIGPIARGRALDFGCGVGRVALPLAMKFDHVVGLDVAPAMLAEGERLRSERGIDNLDFRLSDDALSSAPGSFDLVHSYIVFQHIPVKRGLPLIGMLLDRVSVGGVASIHVAIRRGDTPLRALFYRARTSIPGLQTLVHHIRGKEASRPMMQMNEYPASAIFTMFHISGFGQAVVDVERHGRFLTMHIAARRLAAVEQGV